MPKEGLGEARVGSGVYRVCTSCAPFCCGVTAAALLATGVAVWCGSTEAGSSPEGGVLCRLALWAVSGMVCGVVCDDVGCSGSRAAAFRL